MYHASSQQGLLSTPPSRPTRPAWVDVNSKGGSSCSPQSRRRHHRTPQSSSTANGMMMGSNNTNSRNNSRSSTPLRGAAAHRPRPLAFSSLLLPPTIKPPSSISSSFSAPASDPITASEKVMSFPIADGRERQGRQQSSSNSDRMSSMMMTMMTNNAQNRVKVGVRCRPPFEDEVESQDVSDGHYFMSHVHISRHQLANQGEKKKKAPRLGRVRLFGTPGSARERDFHFDYAFGPKVGQEEIYQQIAKPVVQDALSGLNGAVLAYGQTGTGKTYTMGMLDPLDGTRATGIVPQALREIFAGIHRHQQRAKQQQTRYRKNGRPHASGLHQEASSITSTEDEEEEGEEERGIGEAEKGKGEECDYEVRLSFLQIYRETIQDLLSPWNVMEACAGVGGGGGPGNEEHENLPVREDPEQGFYVEGLQEYIVSDASQAAFLINLDQRLMALLH